MSTADTILTINKTLKERGVPDGSYFKIVFRDGSEITEHDTAWSMISERKTVDFMGQRKIVHVCIHPVKSLEMNHDGLKAVIDVPHGCEVYQAVRGEAVIVPNVQRTDKVVGRIIGIVKDGKVVEERFLDSVSHKVVGVKI